MRIKRINEPRTFGRGTLFAFGQAAYRASQAYSQGASFRETITAGLNGAGEVYGVMNDPTKFPDLFKGDPQTDSFSSDTRKMIQAGLQSLGLDPATAKVGTWAIEVTLTTGNRSYGDIVGREKSNSDIAGPATFGYNLFRDFRTIYDISRDFLRIPGWNDGGDAIRHASWMKSSAEKTNPLTAYVAGVGHEVEGLLKWILRQPRNQTFGDLINENRMDLHNNAEGIRAAIQKREIDTSNLVSSPNENKIPY